VELIGTKGWVELQVIDRGVGFDPEKARDRGLGLVSIEERVKLLHGSLVLKTRPGEGTELKVRIPSRNLHGNKIRVLLADDHKIVAEGLRHLLEGEFELVGIVGDGRAMRRPRRNSLPTSLLLTFPCRC
jgi:hypothetical protein